MTTKKNQVHKLNEKRFCFCWICESVKDFNNEYYDNPSVLRDNDRAVHIAKVMK